MPKESPKFLVKPVISGGQEYISFALLAKRLGKKTPTIMEAKEKKWFTASVYRGTPCAKWPHARDEYLQAASMGKGHKSFALTAAKAGVPGLTRENARADLAQRQGEDPDAPNPKVRGKPRLAETAEAAGRKIHYESELKRIEFEKRIGSLVPLADVKKLFKDIATNVKQSLRSIPPRVAPMIFGELDEHKVLMLLTREIDKALEAIDVQHDYRTEPADDRDQGSKPRSASRTAVSRKPKKSRR